MESDQLHVRLPFSSLLSLSLVADLFSSLRITATTPLLRLPTRSSFPSLLLPRVSQLEAEPRRVFPSLPPSSPLYQLRSRLLSLRIHHQLRSFHRSQQTLVLPLLPSFSSPSFRTPPLRLPVPHRSLVRSLRQVRSSFSREGSTVRSPRQRRRLGARISSYSCFLRTRGAQGHRYSRMGRESRRCCRRRRIHELASR